MSLSPSVQPSAPTAAAASAGGSGGLRFVDMQQAEEMLASTLIGTPVNNGANSRLGDINDVLFDADGRLKAVVVGVGGFLGIAERDVAVPWDAFGVNRVEDQNPMLRLDVSREQLEAAPEFVSVEERRMADEAARAAQTPRRPVPGPEALWRRHLFRERRLPLLHRRSRSEAPYKAKRSAGACFRRGAGPGSL